MIGLILRFRAYTGLLFGGFEHIAAIGFALHHYHIRGAYLVLGIGHFGLLLILCCILIDQSAKNEVRLRKFLRRLKAGYRDVVDRFD